MFGGKVSLLCRESPEGLETYLPVADFDPNLQFAPDLPFGPTVSLKPWNEMHDSRFNKPTMILSNSPADCPIVCCGVESGLHEILTPVEVQVRKIVKPIVATKKITEYIVYKAIELGRSVLSFQLLAGESVGRKRLNNKPFIDVGHLQIFTSDNVVMSLYEASGINHLSTSGVPVEFVPVGAFASRKANADTVDQIHRVHEEAIKSGTPPEVELAAQSDTGKARRLLLKARKARTGCPGSFPDFRGSTLLTCLPKSVRGIKTIALANGKLYPCAGCCVCQLHTGDGCGCNVATHCPVDGCLCTMRALLTAVSWIEDDSNPVCGGAEEVVETSATTKQAGCCVAEMVASVKAADNMERVACASRPDIGFLEQLCSPLDSCST